MFPLIPLLALVAILGGGGVLVWYDQLSEEDREEADRIACEYAKELFNKSLEDLSKDEAHRVARLTRAHFRN